MVNFQPIFFFFVSAIDASLFFDPRLSTSSDSGPKADAGLTMDLVYKNDRPFEFLSIFAWSHRKGWDLLLDGYFSAFSSSDNVLLRIKSYVPDFIGGDKNITRRIQNYKMSRFKNLTALPRVVWDRGDAFDHRRNLQPLNESIFYNNNNSHKSESKGIELSRRGMRAILASADAFVLPSRGEGW